MGIAESSMHNIISAILLAAMISPALALSGEKTNRPFKANLVTHEQAGFTPNCPSKFGGLRLAPAQARTSARLHLQRPIALHRWRIILRSKVPSP